MFDDKSEWLLLDSNVTNKEPVGYCCYRNHRGYISQNILKEKQCLRKECTCLIKNENHPYWKERERIKALKRAKKQESYTYTVGGKTYLTTKEKGFLLLGKR